MKNFFLFFLLLFPFYSRAQIITTVAGNGTPGYNGDNIVATNAELLFPYDVALDGLGNFYIADGYNDRIRKVNPTGIITTIAGTGIGGYNGDGIPATAAQLHYPVGIICDHYGNIYFADAYNNRVRKIDTAGIITTVAGNGNTIYNGDNILADSAAIYDPHAVALDAQGDLYITDFANNRIRKVNTAGIITTIVGTGTAGYTGDNGPATAAEIYYPYGIALDDTGNIYFVDSYNNVVRKIDTLGVITTIAGTGVLGSIGDNGPADAAELGQPGCLAIDGYGNIYIADIDNNRIRKVTAVSDIITTIAGDGVLGFSGDNSPATAAEISEPTGVTVDATGNIYIADFGNDRIRYISNTTTVNSLNSADAYINIYPNPSQGLFTINITSTVNEQVQINITNMLGEKVKEASVFTNIPLIIELDQPDGIYFLSVISTGGIINKTINIEK